MIELKNNPTGNFFLLAGPCVIEGEEMAMRIAERVVKITEALQIPYVFKGSYRKANRSRLDSFTGIGDEKALKVLRKVHETFGVPTVTDIHTADEAAMAGSVFFYNSVVSWFFGFRGAFLSLGSGCYCIDTVWMVFGM